MVSILLRPRENQQRHLCPPRTINVVRDDPVGLETGIELVAHAMDDDGVQSDAVEEVERECEGLEVVGEDGAADLEDGKVGRGREDLEVARDFAARGERVQQSDNRLLRACASVSVGSPSFLAMIHLGGVNARLIGGDRHWD
jgi:hypothetical protein